MEPLIAAGLALVGTVLAVAAGFWQWRRTQAHESGSAYRAHRVAALEEVWNALSDLEERLRSQVMRGEADGEMASLRYQEEIGRVNMLVLRRSPFLLTDEQDLAQRYLYRLIEINTMIRVGPQDRALDDASAMSRGDSGWWDSTMEQPPQASIVAFAATDLQRLRRELGGRYAAVVQGTVD
ncbi:hypothetical protein LO763_25410 [Glycomyces sp. A-F 0318]|uniref:hypothetical protein n=1 Tax=Glycomyces amatae TaxID=2881355 RepID=UPI001E37F824|nr:hypothetical protein [Glycomyces amatae]MCD0446963.1 hypothetical protein [Glycomyces amatae]